MIWKKVFIAVNLIYIIRSNKLLELLTLSPTHRSFLINRNWFTYLLFAKNMRIWYKLACIIDRKLFRLHISLYLLIRNCHPITRISIIGTKQIKRFIIFHLWWLYTALRTGVITLIIFNIIRTYWALEIMPIIFFNFI